MNGRIDGTGLFDEDDNSLISNEPAIHLSKPDKPATARNFLLFFSLIIIIIICVNHNSVISSLSSTSDEAKAKIKKQLLESIMEQPIEDKPPSNKTISTDNQILHQ
jgi:hypothetical protein